MLLPQKILADIDLVHGHHMLLSDLLQPRIHSNMIRLALTKSRPELRKSKRDRPKFDTVKRTLFGRRTGSQARTVEPRHTVSGEGQESGVMPIQTRNGIQIGPQIVKPNTTQKKHPKPQNPLTSQNPKPRTPNPKAT